MSINLLPGEKVVHEGELHWIVFIPSLIVLSIAAAMMTGPRGISWPFMFALAWLVAKVLDYKNSSFIVTNKRVIVRTGWTSSNRFELLLAKIEAVNVQQTFTTIADLGTVTLVGSGGTSVKIKNLKSPDDFQHAVQGQAIK